MNNPMVDTLVEAFSGFGEFEVLDREAVMTALAVDEAGLQALIASENFPEPTHAGKWSLPHIRSHLGRLAERDQRLEAISMQEAHSIRLIEESEALAILDCNRPALWEKVLTGALPYPTKSNGRDVWRHDEVIATTRKNKRENPRQYDPMKLMNESQAQAELDCNAVDLYRKILAGALPWPQKSNGKNAWFYGDVIKARGAK